MHHHIANVDGEGWTVFVIRASRLLLLMSIIRDSYLELQFRGKYLPDRKQSLVDGELISKRKTRLISPLIT